MRFSEVPATPPARVQLTSSVGHDPRHLPCYPAHAGATLAAAVDLGHNGAAEYLR